MINETLLNIMKNNQGINYIVNKTIEADKNDDSETYITLVESLSSQLKGYSKEDIFDTLFVIKTIE